MAAFLYADPAIMVSPGKEDSFFAAPVNQLLELPDQPVRRNRGVDDDLQRLTSFRNTGPSRNRRFGHFTYPEPREEWRHEEVEAHRGADRIRTAKGANEHQSRGDLPLAGRPPRCSSVVRSRAIGAFRPANVCRTAGRPPGRAAAYEW